MYPNLRAEMARKNVNCLELSERTGIPYTTLTAVIRGRTEKLSFENAVKIKKALNLDMPLEELFEKEEN